MKKLKWAVLILMMLISGCKRNDFDKGKPSLLLKYYNSASNWAGVILGETTFEETQIVLAGLDELQESSITTGSTVINFDEGVCAGFVEGFREHAVCVHCLDGKAEAIEFYGQLTIDEINQQLGTIEKIGIVYHENEIRWIASYGISRNAGYVFAGDAEAEIINESITHASINSDSLAGVSLVNPELFEFYMLQTMIRESTVRYFFEEDGFEDWHGPGEYRVYVP